MGHETVLAEVERVAVVDNRPPVPVDVVVARPEDGLLTVRWEPYRRHNFQAYAVRDEGRYGAWSVRERVESRRQTAWADPSYLGGRRTYGVLVEAGGQTVAGEPLTVDYPVPTLAEAVPEGGGRVRIAWHATPFTGAFKSYELSRESSYHDRTVVETTDAVDDTVFVDAVDDVFGRGHPYVLRTGGAGRRARTCPAGSRSLPTRPRRSGAAWSASPGGAVLGVDVETRRLALRDARTLALRAAAPLPEDAFVYDYAASPSGRVGVLAGWGAGRTYAIELDGATLQTLHRADVTGPDGVGRGPADDVESRVFMTDGGVLVFGIDPPVPEYDYRGPYLLAVDVASGRVVGQVAGTDPPPRPPAGPPPSRATAGTVVTGPFDVALYERDEGAPSGYRFVSRLERGFAEGAAFVSPSRLVVVGYHSGPGGVGRGSSPSPRSNGCPGSTSPTSRTGR